MSYGPADIPPPPPAGRPARSGGPGRVPLWVPLTAGLAVVAVAAVAVALIAGGGTKTATTTTVAALSTTTTTTSATTTTAPPTTTTTTSAGPEAGGSWTVLVYGLGDNNLEGDLLGDLQEMAAVPPAALTFFVLADRTPDYTDAALPGIGDWETAKLLTVGPGAFTEVADLGELDLGDPAVLTDFITRGIGAYPADHYALILWDHGSIAGVGSDESSGDGLAIPEIAAGTRAGLDAAGVDRLDLLGFDACLMGAYEVAAALTGVADYMVASEEVEPLNGWDYAAFDILATQPDTVTASSLGQEVVSRYLATTGPNDPTITMSLLDLSHMGDLVTALGNLNGAVAPQMSTFAAAIGRGRNEAPSYGASPLPEEDFYMVDLGSLLQSLVGAEAPLGDAASAALAVYDEVVVASQAGAAAGTATGLTVHFPPYPDFYYPDWYAGTEAPVWPDFLEAYYAAGAAIPEEAQPSFAPVGNQASHYFDEFGLSVEAIFDAGAVENIVDAVLYTGTVEEDGTVTFIGEDQGLYEGNQALASNDLTVLILDDGQDQAIAYQDISFTEDLSIFMLDVPLAYYPPQSAEYRDITLHLTYNAATEEFTEGFYASDEFGTVSEFQADPAGLIVPWMLEWRPDGTYEWVQTTDVGLWADLPNLLYEFRPLTPGTRLYAELNVFDYGGNSDYAFVDTVVPSEEADWQACTNDTWGFQVSYPDGWFTWPSPTPELDCAYFDPSSMEGLTEEEAFDQAALTVEVYEAAALTEVLDFLTTQSAATEEATLGDRAVTIYESVRGEFGYRAYVIPLRPDGTTLMVAAWGNLDDSLAAIADRAAGSLVFLG